MTVGVLCLDGLDWRLADDVGLFDDVPVTGGELRNDLDGEHPLFTPRVWTSIMAGQDQDAVTGWLSGDDWADATRDLTFIWNHVEDCRVQGLSCHRDAVTISKVMPNPWVFAASSAAELRQMAKKRAGFWNAELAQDPSVLVAWFRFADGVGHQALKTDDPLEPAYRWMRDTLFDAIDWPDDVVVISDHGFVRNTATAKQDLNRGRNAHRRTGVCATSDSLSDLRRYDDLSAFIDGWQDVVLDRLRRKHLDALGY